MRRIGNFAIAALVLVFFGVAVRGDDDHGRDRDSRVAWGLLISPVRPHIRSEIERLWVW